MTFITLYLEFALVSFGFVLKLFVRVVVNEVEGSRRKIVRRCFGGNVCVGGCAVNVSLSDIAETAHFPLFTSLQEIKQAFMCYCSQDIP
jgi:hypothetical protein